MKTKGERQFLTISDVAKQLGLSVVTVRRYVRNGTFPHPKREFFGRQSVAIYSSADVEALSKILERLRKGVGHV
mgnify:CR=1 FL=1|jgi:Predicted transcriptional regulators